MALVAYSLFDLCEAQSEEKVESVLSSFSCERNSDIELFVHRKALEFNKRGAASSYLVFDVDSASFVGFYALALKVASIPAINVSRSFRKKFEYFGEYDSASNSIELPVVLLAQFGKNDRYANLVSGEQLMSLAEDSAREVHRLAGGRFVVLDAVDAQGLLTFYTNLGFRKYGNRENCEDVFSDSASFVQMFKYVHPNG